MKKEAEVLDAFEAARQAFFSGGNGTVSSSASVVTFVRSLDAPVSSSSVKASKFTEKELSRA